MNSLQGSKPLLMILPGLLLAMFIIGYPIVDLANSSLHEVSRFGQLRGFNGLDNFSEVFADSLFYESLRRTVIWTVAVVLGTLVISLPIAMITRRISSMPIR